jgi:aldehyde:ferredoxin oxidoreductase
MTLGGYANRIAHVDLTSRAVEYKPIPEDWALKYIGARGLGVRYLLENGPQVEPLAPDNLLCFMNGPLTGTDANMSGRMAIVTKSPLTGTVTDSHHGGWSAARMRWAGFDGLIFKGKADKPVYAYVHDGEIEILDASEVWGKGVHDTVRFFRERYGEKDLTVIAIGPGGENQVRFACWVNENDRASGRGGTGCVGGSKNLKAVVVKAAKKLPKAANAEAWKPAHKRALAVIMDEQNITSPRKGGLSVYGTNVLMNITNTMGALPTKNSQTTSFGADGEKISGEYVNDNILVDNPTCHACPVACKKEVEIKEGPWKGLRMESVEYEPAWSVGANCGNNDVNTVAKLIDMCNDYGLDAIEIGHPLGLHGGHREGLHQRRRRPGLGRHPRYGRGHPQDRLSRGHRQCVGRGRCADGHALRPPRAGHGGQGPGHSGLRPAWPEGHGHWLCHQQPRRMPPAGLHAGSRAGRDAIRLAQGRPAGVEG